MGALLAVGRFELGLRLRRPSTAVLFALFLLLGHLAVQRGKGPLLLMEGASALCPDTRAPYVLHFLVNVTGVLGSLVTCAIFGRAGLRDFRDRTHALLFSYPIREGEYLAGRFLAALAAALLVFSGTGLGAWLAGPAAASAGGRVPAAAYLLPYAVGLAPTLAALGAAFFAVAVLTRKAAPVWATAVAFVLLHVLGRALGALGSTRVAGALVDPFGHVAARTLHSTWSLAERAERLVVPTGLLLANRLLWLGVAAAVLAFLWSRFRLVEVVESRAGRPTAPAEAAGLAADLASLPRPAERAGAGLRLRQAWATAALDLGGLVRNVSFLLLLALASALHVVVSVRNAGLVGDTTAYPLTAQVLEAGLVPLHPALVLLVLFASAELVRGGRSRGLHLLLDPTPVPEAVFFLGKAGALVAVVAGVCLLAMANGMAVQAWQGWTRFEPGLYLTELLGLRLAGFASLAVLALFAQVLCGSRVLGWVLTLLLADDAMDLMGLEHRLLTFGRTPPHTYSDMNGYGPFAPALFSYTAFWLLASVLVAVGALLLYPRGQEGAWRLRLREARRRFTRGPRALAAGAALACLALGSAIVHQTTILNEFESTADEEDRRAEYERLFKAWERRPAPRTTSVTVTVDIHPGDRRVASRGEIVLVNQGDVPVAEAFVQVPRRALVRRLELDRPSEVLAASARHGVRVLRLREPLAPGQALRLCFDMESRERGFADHGVNTRLVANGTFLEHRQVLPALSYDRFAELDESSARRRRGLPPRRRLPAREDREARAATLLGADAGWARLEVVVGTSADQVPLTAGDLVADWREGGRRYRRFVSRVPTLSYLAFLSARYEVRKERWNGVDIEVYHHPGHGLNVEGIVTTARAALALFSEKLGPYPHGALRFAEFPRYELSAEAYPGLVPVSEGFGFVARPPREGVEELRRVIAHEVAHQWWGLQAMGAASEGEFFVCETLAQHGALEVLRRRHGEVELAAYLKGRLERYLRGRGRETEGERPLARSNYETHYVHYDKGMLVMNALRDAMGEEALDAAVRAFFRRASLHTVPFPSSEDLIAELRKVAPPEAQETLTDLLERIVIWDVRATGAAWSRLPGGTYRVAIDYEAAKRVHDERGTPTDQPFRQDVELAVFGEGGEVVSRLRRPVGPGPGRVDVVVGARPAVATIDPFHLLVDRNPDDNRVVVREAGEPGPG